MRITKANTSMSACERVRIEGEYIRKVKMKVFQDLNIKNAVREHNAAQEGYSGRQRISNSIKMFHVYFIMLE